ncbi:tyrosine-type recombinase/integrase [Bradyrhizobium elkanii]
MPKELLKANDITRRLSQPGKHRDGAGLYLQVAAKGRASWTYQFRFNGGTHWMSIGPAATFTLTEARERHGHLRRMRDRGIDPRTVPHDVSAFMVPTTTDSATMARAEPQAATGPLFSEVVEMFIAEFGPDWAGGMEGKEVASYRRTLIRDCTLARLGVGEIKTEHVEAALKHWADKPVTAEKVLMRVGKILNYATAKKLRTGDNPARIRGHFEFLARPVVPESEHHPAMQAPDVPSFVKELLANGSSEAKALAFLILTGARSDEVRLARWKEIKGNVWTVPAERMKGKKKDRRPHSVPVSPAALKLIGKPGDPEHFIFPGRRYGARKPLWHSAMREIMKALIGDRLSVEGLQPVPHGFRSTFRDWAAEAGYPRDLAERAIAHKVNGKTESAYQRSKLIELRRPMMQRWAAYVTGAK